MSEIPLTGSPLVCLTLVLPRASEDRVIDFLMARHEDGVEFSAHPVAARGPLVHMAETDEQVAGFARRIELRLVLPRPTARRLLVDMEALLAGVDGGWWASPVEVFSAFARRAQEAA